MLNFDDIDYLHSRGFSLIYLPAKSKGPKGVEYIGWASRENYTLDELRDAYDANKNLAVRLGNNSLVGDGYALVAVDFDVKVAATNGQRNEITKLLISLLRDPKIFPAVKSGSHTGSMHFYAKCPCDLVTSDVHIFKSPWGEIVLKGQGSLIVLPTSTHPTSNKQYEWVRHIRDFELPDITEFPIYSQINSDLKYDIKKIDRLILSESTDLDALKISNEIKALITDGDTWGKYPSRSEAIYAVIHALVNVGASDESITSILTNPENMLSQAVLERSKGSIDDGEKWLLPQIYKAAISQLERVKQDFLEPLLEKTEKKTVNKLQNAITFNFNTIRCLDDIKQHPFSRWIIPGRFLEKQITITAAPGGSGKSAYSLQEAMAIALNKDLGVGNIRRSGNVLVYNTEDDLDEVFRRVYAICKHFRIQPYELMGKLFIANTSNHGRLVLVSSDNNKKTSINVENAIHLKQQIVDNNIILCVIDPLVKFHAINENDNANMDILASLFTLLAQQTNCAFNLIHHTKKPSGTISSAGDADAIRGASALVNAARIAHTFTGMSKKDAESLAIDVKHRKRYVRLDSAKQNLYLDLDEAMWFEKVSVCLDNDPNNVESDWRCAFVPWNEPSVVIEGVTVAVADNILSFIRECQDTDPLLNNTSHRNYIIPKIVEKFDLDESIVKNVLNYWKNTGSIEVVEIDKNKHLKAFKVKDNIF